MPSLPSAPKPLAFGWACGTMPVAASVFLTVLAVLIAHRLLGPLGAGRASKLTNSLSAAWCLLTTAGLISTFAAPMP